MAKTEFSPRPVYALVGKDRFMRSEALDELLKRFGPDIDFDDPTRVNGLQADPASVLDDVRTRTLLGACRVVIVEDADVFITNHRSALEQYAASPSDAGRLVLLCESMPKNTRLFKAIQEKGEVIFCEAPKGRALISWIAKHVQKTYSKRCGDAAAAKLIEHVGGSSGALDSELAKLASFVGDCDEITTQDVDTLTGNLHEEKIFAVSDALADGNTAQALAAWQQVLVTDRAAPGRALGGLIWSVRRLLDAQKDVTQGVSLSVVSGRMYTDPAVLKRRLERSSMPRLLRRQQEMLAADAAVKTGGSTPEIAIEKIIVMDMRSKAPKS